MKKPYRFVKKVRCPRCTELDRNKNCVLCHGYGEFKSIHELDWMDILMGRKSAKKTIFK